MKADLHFHPNLPLYVPFFGKRFGKMKVKAMWKAILRADLDVVLVCEHVYKNPLKSFALFQDAKPATSNTILIPGIEYLTKEGVDIIIFSEEFTSIASHPDLLTPKKLTLEECVSKVTSDTNLHGIVPHPYTPGLTSAVRNCGEERAHVAIEAFGMVEKHNCALATLQLLLEKLHITWAAAWKYKQMLQTMNAPDAICQRASICTGGSDAHHPWEVGDYMDIPTDAPQNTADAISCISSAQGTFVEMRSRFLPGLIVSTGTVISEWMIKTFKLYNTKQYVPSPQLLHSERATETV